MGFGHRVYRNYDPRAKILKTACDDALAALGVSSPISDIARKLEEVALQDSYFIERKLYPNVDFLQRDHSASPGLPNRYLYSLICHWQSTRLVGSLAGDRIERKENPSSPPNLSRRKPSSLYWGFGARIIFRKRDAWALVPSHLPALNP